MKRTNALLGLVGIAALALIAGSAIAQNTPATSPSKATQPEKVPKDKDQTKDKEKDKDHKKDKTAAGPANPGATAPDFTGTDTEGKTVSLASLSKGDKIVVVQWFNFGCPFVVKHYGETKTFNDLYAKYHEKGVEFVAVCSSAPGQQGSGKEANTKMKKEWSIPYPIILDEEGVIGRAYGATRTPQTIVIGKDGKVAYNGAPDDDKGSEKPGKTNYISKALDELLAGTNVTMNKTAPYGCPVKYSKQ
ncbi:Thiol-disulfide oxidoreductase ResA [Phycisphaerales bacterium]|nr:Thiol-disulfide oxidoreductase ResA [Phycisphaerales bacterium]